MNCNRREFLKTLGAGLTLTAFNGCQLIPQIGADQPNVLFIAVDDLNDWVNVLGGRPGVHTPNIDRLAERGVVFTNAHCSSPSCNPSRASIMTGVRPSTSGIYNNRQHWRESPVLRDARTIPEHFHSIGYHTTGGGKIFHCLSWIKTSYGSDENDYDIWDDYFPSKTRAMPESVWPEGTVRNDEGTFEWDPVAKGRTDWRPSYYFDWGPLKTTDEEMADFQVVDWAIGELKKEHEKPFFQAVGIFRPHIPWFIPQKYFNRYPLNEITLPPVKERDLEDCSSVGKSFCRRKWQEWILENDMWKQAVQGYLAGISFADAQVGRLLDALDASSYAENTMIVLWSDHGMHIGEKEHWEKFTLWEESTRVPLIITAPGVATPGGRCGRPVSLLDVYPTLIELCGNRPYPSLEGQSLVPLLRDTQASRERPAITTWGFNNHAVRTERWRYIRYNDGSEELYDHQSDPDEYTNLAGQSQYKSKKEDLAQWLPTTNALFSR